MLTSRQAPQKPEEYYATPAVTRYFSQIQSLPQLTTARQQFPNDFPLVEFDLDNMPKAERKAPAPKVKKAKAAPAPASAAAKLAQEGGSAIIANVQAAAAGVAGAAQAVKDAVIGKADDAAAAATSSAPKDGKKKEKKEKKPAAPKKEEPVATGPLPSMIDLRVGKVLEGESNC